MVVWGEVVGFFEVDEGYVFCFYEGFDLEGLGVFWIGCFDFIIGEYDVVVVFDLDVFDDVFFGDFFVGVFVDVFVVYGVEVVFVELVEVDFLFLCGGV